jgi:myo-inositol 2-dehydrogenase / D-chiro-inositol 1-dehydrogenase
MKQPVSIAVIGCGDVAISRHLPALAASPEVRLVACCDREQDRAAAAARQFKALRATTSVDEVLGSTDVDAVIVATPPWVTPRIAIAALEADKDVLAEKPIALTLDEAIAVRRASNASKAFLQVGFVLRHGLLFGTLRRWVSEDRLGSPLDLRVSIFDERLDPEDDPEHYRRIMATLEHGAPCIHDGAHTMDHLHFLLGERAAGISAWGRSTRPEFPRPNLNGAVIEFSNGHRARVEIGWFLPSFPPSEWTIVGPKGLATFNPDTASVALRAEDGDETMALGEAWIPACFREQLATFVEAVRSRTAPEPGPNAAIASLALSQQFEAAMATPLQPREVMYP